MTAYRSARCPHRNSSSDSVISDIFTCCLVVHNWTVAQMVEWLSVDVDLPQYADNFKQYGIMGAAMPM